MIIVESNSFDLLEAFLARICLLRSVVPDGSVILYRPSCSGNTRRGGFFAGADSKISISSTLIPEKEGRCFSSLHQNLYPAENAKCDLLCLDVVATNGLTDAVVMDAFSDDSIFSRVA